MTHPFSSDLVGPEKNLFKKHHIEIEKISGKLSGDLFLL